MVKLKIKNVGPICDLSVDFKRINVLIGPQASGKSTLAKIFSNATWLEKEVLLSHSFSDFEPQGEYLKKLEHFHKLKGYFSKSSTIEYESESIHFIYEDESFSGRFLPGADSSYRKKTLYIPSERNMVSVIDNWFDIDLKRDNTQSFLADWARVRQNYHSERKLDLLGLASYSYQPGDGSDHILVGDTDLPPHNVASGLQSLLPLVALIQFYSEDWYTSERKEWQDRLNVFLEYAYLDKAAFPPAGDMDSFQKLVRGMHQMIHDSSEADAPTKWREHARHNYHPFSTVFIIEEPELNLYPTAQHDLMRYLVRQVNTSSDHPHSLLLTTHSPYLIATLNLLGIANEYGKEKKHESEIDQIIPAEEWVATDEVTAWQLNQDGSQPLNIMDSEQQIIQVEKLDSASDKINYLYDKIMDIHYQDQ